MRFFVFLMLSSTLVLSISGKKNQEVPIAVMLYAVVIQVSSKVGELSRMLRHTLRHDAPPGTSFR